MTRDTPAQLQYLLRVMCRSHSYQHQFEVYLVPKSMQNHCPKPFNMVQKAVISQTLGVQVLQVSRSRNLPVLCVLSIYRSLALSFSLSLSLSLSLCPSPSLSLSLSLSLFCLSFVLCFVCVCCFESLYLYFHLFILSYLSIPLSIYVSVHIYTVDVHLRISPHIALNLFLSHSLWFLYLSLPLLYKHVYIDVHNHACVYICSST